MTASFEHAAPLPSRAASIAEIYLDPINASRKRAGLEPLAACELAHEFADVDSLPARTRKLSRRGAGNLAVLRSGGPTDQAGIDAMWSGITAKLNASLPASRTPIGAHRSLSTVSVEPTQTAVDWGSIAAELNREAGLRAPARNRVP
jgi:hypothetical protein